MAESSAVLAKLHDIHLPAPIGWWPLAPGWYLLLFLCLILIVFLIYLARRTYANGQAKRQALQLLEVYEQEYRREQDSQASSMKVSELLRRVALVYFPREEVASLQGEAWLEFLNKTSKGIEFNKLRNYLLEIPYQPATDIDLQPLFHCAKAWIKQRGAPCLS
ncbi:DUF4381 domain-containing protein [Legionella micdadei]|uniref:DUF4381 domain-containing protein n=1 Tax=Legionella micdadei TaxID=451 RepID=A0A098GAK7_LEGMI|nr:DUF4381 domain-containing protein [Legionella micdadei]ARG96328.1 hypothetical protein B6N58_00735 [Legionella micdadei]ARG99081.1 hypothetical protein B6V88_00735 [Legionella micdadei]KTD29593.1 hypothetical protein Lmic_0665 [Legionella micdadei]NSL19442.1 DUF4381 domain-containing protein [Legionella micdadei]CEG59524.1 conserved protein of unknown function [Legionella micdadei]